MSVLDSKTHVVVVPLQEWGECTRLPTDFTANIFVAGHTRPLTGLVSRIVQARPITVTFFVPKYFYERVSIELSRHLGDAPSVERNSIRFVILVERRSTRTGTTTFIGSLPYPAPNRM